MNSYPKNINSSLLLELPLPFMVVGGCVYVEAQAANGIKLWCDNFSRVTVCAPVIPDGMPSPIGFVWVPFPKMEYSELVFVGLPWAYKLIPFIRFLPKNTRLFGELIDKHDYLCFSNLGFIGAWGLVAGIVAKGRRRKYAVWLDWVLHDMPVDWGRGRFRAAFDWIKKKTLIKWFSFYSIRNASLGLFHGKTVFDAYHNLVEFSEVVHDISTGEEDLISDQDFLRKRFSGHSKDLGVGGREGRSLVEGDGFFRSKHPCLRIAYLGRVDSMKGPTDWVDVLAEVKRCGLDFEAVWVGDGVLLENSRRGVSDLNIDENVRFLGGVYDRTKVLDFLKQADVFLFCHLTPESPRCLIESIVCGTPLIGYRSSYVEDLASGNSCCELVDIGDKNGLVASVLEVCCDSERLIKMTSFARVAGRRFTGRNVFKERSDLIKKHCFRGGSI